MEEEPAQTFTEEQRWLKVGRSDSVRLKFEKAAREICLRVIKVHCHRVTFILLHLMPHTFH